MYSISTEISMDTEPWKISLNDRIRMVNSASMQGKRIALMLYRAADTSTFRYRCYNVMQHLKQSNRWSCVYFFRDEVDKFHMLLPKASLCILARIKWDHAIDDVAHHAKMLKIPVLFDVDDYVCDIKKLKVVTNTLGVPFPGEVHYDFWFADISRLEATASLCDGFLTTNDYLGRKLQARFQKPYRLIRNTLNKEQIAVSKACQKIKKKQKSKKPFTIGYFSGTPSHINDFKTIAQELVKLLHEFPDIHLEVVGFMEFPEFMQELIRDKRISFIPLVDFLELQRLMAEVDISIVPLIQNEFTNCKSELKFFEASMVKTVTIAAPIYTYNHSIEDGVTGYLCEPGQWYDRIRELYLHPETMKTVTERAYDYCLNRYYGRKVLEEIEASYDYFCKDSFLEKSEAKQQQVLR